MSLQDSKVMPKANDDEKIDVSPPTNLEKAHDKDKVEAHDREMLMTCMLMTT